MSWRRYNTTLGLRTYYLSLCIGDKQFVWMCGQHCRDRNVPLIKEMNLYILY